MAQRRWHWRRVHLLRGTQVSRKILCPVCGSRAWDFTVEKFGSCFKCCGPSGRPDFCPRCSKRRSAKDIERLGVCSICAEALQSETEARTLDGNERERVLMRHSTWLHDHPTAWARATHGLRMFVPDNGRGYWP